MGQYVQRMVVWASGKIEFCGDQPEPGGALPVCVVQGKDAMEQLAELVVDASEAWYFDDGLALKVPGIDPHREEVPRGIDPAIETLIEWGDQLRNEIGIDPAFVWARA